MFYQHCWTCNQRWELGTASTCKCKEEVPPPTPALRLRLRLRLRRFRITTDVYAGYEVQIWRLWWPFWIQYRMNTFACIEDAKAYLNAARETVVWIEP